VSADLFRLKLLEQGLGIWIDADLYFIRPLEHHGEMVFGWKDRNWLNNAVLWIPSDSQLLGDLIRYAFDQCVVPPWWPSTTKVARRMLAESVGSDGFSDLPAGALGPHAFTYFATQHGAQRYARSVDVFYPLHGSKAQRLYDPEYDVKAHVTDATITIHLWNNLLRHRKTSAPPEGSFMHAICMRHNVFDSADIP
jgi:hypothetical protein